MRRFKVPLIEQSVYLYHGDELDKWARAAEVPPPPDGSRPRGCVNQNMAWVYSLSDTDTVFHEISHIIDYVMSRVDSDDAEFRAYVSGWLYGAVHRWITRSK